MTRFSRRQSFVMLGSLLALTACGESWQTSYTPIPISPASSVWPLSPSPCPTR